MKGFLTGALMAATITTANGQDAEASSLPFAPDASIELFEMGFNSGERSGRFILENNLQIQPMRHPGGGIYSAYEHEYIAVSCDDLLNDFEESVNFIDESARPTLIRIDHAAIRPSIVAAAKKAADQCSPEMM